MSNVIDLSAKLLANEDVSVRRAKTRTASFDIKSRVLTLPLWQEMTPEIEQMLVGHEVGHALYTTDEYGDAIKENTDLKSYLNVLEDVRIEKLIKQKYPGIRKHMAAGYKQLNERDFFEIDGKDVNTMLLIDRINLYFKAGLFNLDFNSIEKQFVVRAERTESIQDVIDLAKEVFEYSKAEYYAKKAEWEAAASEEDEEEDFDGQDLSGFNMDDGEDDEDWDDDDVMQMSGDSDSDEDSEESEEDSDSWERGTEKGQELNPLESATQRAFDAALEDLADTDTEYQYWTIAPVAYDPIVPYKRVLSEMADEKVRWMEGYDEVNNKLRDEFQQFKTESLKTVNYLVKEFEMRKSATLYKRTQVAKSGQLDMKKIFGYKINDDLFKRVNIIPEGKNHGMMILVDWSGSMQNVMMDTVKQVVNLALFCQRVKIPYQVLAFTSQYSDRRMSEEERTAIWAKKNAEYERIRDSNEPTIVSRDFHLLELFSHRMSSSEFYQQAANFLDYRFMWSRRFGLGGTPLNEALVWVYHNLGDFINKNNIEKTTFITLTDGEGGQMECMNSAGRNLCTRHIKEYGYWDREKEVRVETTYVNYKNFYRDEVTKKTYILTDDANQQTRSVLKMIKDRYNVNTVGFYICSNSKRDLYWAVASNSKVGGTDIYMSIEKVKRAFRAEGFASLQGSGRDELFLVPKNKMKLDEGELNANGGMTSRKLASQFGKYLNQKKTSRVLLNRFIGWVA